MSYKQLLCTIPTNFDLSNHHNIFSNPVSYKDSMPAFPVSHQSISVSRPLTQKSHSAKREIFIYIENQQRRIELESMLKQKKNWYILSIGLSRILLHPQLENMENADIQNEVVLICTVGGGYLKFNDRISCPLYEKRYNERCLKNIFFSLFNPNREEIKDIHNDAWNEVEQYMGIKPSLVSVLVNRTSVWKDYIEFKRTELQRVEGIYYQFKITKMNDDGTITCKVLREKTDRDLSKYDIVINKDFYDPEEKKIAELSLKEEKQSQFIFNIDWCDENRFIPETGDKFFFHLQDTGTRVMLNRLEKNLKSLMESDNLTSIRTAQWLLGIEDSRLYNNCPNHPFEFHNEHLNEEQQAAVRQMMRTDDVSFILGPPGTGKTSVISEAIYQLTKNNKTIFLSSQSNDAIDNALERLPKTIDIRPVRLGTKIQEGNEFHESKLALNMVENLESEVNKRNEKSKRWVKERKDKYCLFDIFEKEYTEDKSKNYHLIFDAIKDRYNVDTDGTLFSGGVPKSVGDAAYRLNGAISFKDTRANNLNQKFYFLLAHIKRQEEIQNIFKKINAFCSRCDNQENHDIDAFYRQRDNQTLVKTLFDTCNVFGITCTSDSAKLTTAFMDRDMVYDYAIIDEVSKATLPEILGCILKARHVILIGDHRQLPPVFQADLDDISEYSPEDIYRFKQLITNTVFKKLYTRANSNIKCMLRKQYRMHNEIANIAISQFYQDKDGKTLLQNGLSDSESDVNKAHNITISGKAGQLLINPKHHIYWIDSTPDSIDNKFYERRKSSSTSLYNQYEINIICSLLKKIDATANRGTTVGVISFYSLQNRKLQSNISQIPFVNIQVTANTVDKFQGQERNIIIVSLVRSKKGHIPRNNSFFKSFERINVAFSRAQNLLVVVGSVRFCEKQIVTIPTISMDDSSPDLAETAIYKKIIQEIDDIGCLFKGSLLLEEKDDADGKEM